MENKIVQLQKAKDLLDQGLINQIEFDSLKKEILQTVSNDINDVSLPSKNVIKSGKCVFSIKRESSFYAMLANVRVYIDGTLVKKLSNGEDFALEIDNGKHFLHCELTSFSNSQTIEFVGNSNEVSYIVSLPKSFNSVAGKGLILNKIKETEPGTYKSSK